MDSNLETIREAGINEIRIRGLFTEGEDGKFTCEFPPYDADSDISVSEVSDILCSPSPTDKFVSVIREMYWELIDEDASELRHMVEDVVENMDYDGDFGYLIDTVDSIMDQVNILPPTEHHKAQIIDLSELVCALDNAQPMDDEEKKRFADVKKLIVIKAETRRMATLGELMRVVEG